MRSKQELSDTIRRDRRAALVVNAHSRRGRRLYQTVHDRLRAAGVTLLGAYPVERAGDLDRVLAEAADLGPDLLVAGGGDGTIGAAARLLAHRDVALGLLPLGTTNNFARTVGVPLDLDAAVGVLTAGKVIDVDLGLIGDTRFTNHVGIGLSADIMLSAPPRLKRIAGRLAYPVTAWACSPGTGRCGSPSAPRGGSTPSPPTRCTSPTADSTPVGRSPPTPTPTTGCWSRTRWGRQLLLRGCSLGGRDVFWCGVWVRGCGSVVPIANTDPEG
ncbi:diacylglycerol/lipid kinase family protein [Micromonospora sp. NPDC003776]